MQNQIGLGRRNKRETNLPVKDLIPISYLILVHFYLCEKVRPKSLARCRTIVGCSWEGRTKVGGTN